MAIELSNYAANQKLKPHFTLIGGDITYANALPAWFVYYYFHFFLLLLLLFISIKFYSYRRWDIFLRQWYQTLRFTQIIASPGYLYFFVIFF